MTKEEIIKRVKESGIEIIPGEVYNVFECCVALKKPGSQVRSYANARRAYVCVTHRGYLKAKYKVCANCGTEHFGMQLQRSFNSCKECRAIAAIPEVEPDPNGEHPRGAYCRHYPCGSGVDCWECTEMEPWFPRTGPAMRVRRFEAA